MLGLAPVPEARASDEPEPERDRVTLVDGTLVVGTIVEVRHEEAVILIDAQGQARTLAWDEVSGIERAAVSRDDDAAVEPVRVRVVLTHPAPVTVSQGIEPELLWRGTSTPRTSRELCQAPCEVVVDRDEGSLLVLKREDTPAAVVELEASRDEATVRVRPGRPRLMIGSLPLMVGGGLSVGGGIIAALLRGRTTLGPGLAMGLGASMATAGVVMLLLSKTRAKILDGA